MRILLISHEASRSGAPRVALLSARAMIEQGHRVELLTRTDGPLRLEFAAVAPTTLEVLTRVRRRLWRTRGLQRLAWLVDSLLALATIARRRPDLVYVNSSAAAVYLRPATLLRRRTVLHVHESGPLVEQFLRRARVPFDLPGIDLVACSSSVHTALCALSGRPAGSVALVASVPDESQVRALAEQPPDRAYAAGQLVVGCCGTVEHRKGADLWVQVASRVHDALPGSDVRFVWIGDLDAPVPGAREAGAEFLGPSPNPYAHMRRFDVATLPSRDDPFPLVVLEAMSLGTPVVAFDVGAVALQVGNAGAVVPAGAVDAFADAVVRLLVDADERARLGDAAARRVDEHFSIRTFNAGLGSVVRGAAAQGASLSLLHPVEPGDGS